MNQVFYCGNLCLGRDLGADAFPLSASSRAEGAWIAGNRVVRLISAEGHVAGHPLFSYTDCNQVERGALLKLLMEKRVAHVLPINRICTCAFETPLLSGEPLRDFGFGPDSNRLTHPQNRRPVWDPQALQVLLGELACALASLHEIGIAHGDPALMNAFVAEQEGVKKAVWLDLNSVRPATEENRALDTACFIELCLWPSLLEARAYSSTLFSELAHTAASAPDVLPRLGQVLATDYSDYQSGDLRSALLQVLRQASQTHRADRFGQVHRALRACVSATYFLDQAVSDQNARFFQSLLAAERTRHGLVEEEIARTQYLRFHEELRVANAAVEELRDWAKQLQEAVQYHERQAEGAKQHAAYLAAEVDRLRNSKI